MSSTQVKVPFARAAAAPEPAPDDARSDAEQEHRERQAKEIVQLIAHRFRAMDKVFGERNPEAVLGQVRTYQLGLVEGALKAEPGLLDAFATDVESTLCDAEAGDARRASAAQLAADLPDLASARGLDCALARDKEDIVVWTALDAWRASGMETTPGVQRWMKTASDERTKARLRTLEELASADESERLALRPLPESVSPEPRAPAPH